MVNDAIGYEVAITEDNKYVGGFLHRHQGRFLKQDQIVVEILPNGTGPKIYKIHKSTIDTIDKNEGSPLIGFEKADKQGLCEIPFL